MNRRLMREQRSADTGGRHKGLPCRVKRSSRRSKRWSVLPASTVDGYIAWEIYSSDDPQHRPFGNRSGPADNRAEILKCSVSMPMTPRCFGVEASTKYATPSDFHWVMGPLGKLHNIVMHIRSSAGRTKEFENLAERIIPLDNRTRRNSWFQMLVIADQKAGAIDTYTKNHFTTLQADYLSPKDWERLRMIKEFLQPFHRATLETQGDQAIIDCYRLLSIIVDNDLSIDLINNKTSLLRIHRRPGPQQCCCFFRARPAEQSNRGPSSIRATKIPAKMEVEDSSVDMC